MQNVSTFDLSAGVTSSGLLAGSVAVCALYRRGTLLYPTSEGCEKAVGSIEVQNFMSDGLRWPIYYGHDPVSPTYVQGNNETELKHTSCVGFAFYGLNGPCTGGSVVHLLPLPGRKLPATATNQQSISFFRFLLLNA